MRLRICAVQRALLDHKRTLMPTDPKQTVRQQTTTPAAMRSLLAILAGFLRARPGSPARAVTFAGPVALLTLVAVLLPALAFAEPPRRMPKYRDDGGELIDDPVQLKQARSEYDNAYETFRRAAASYRAEVKDFITAEVQGRAKQLGAGYATQIEGLEDAQFELRREAIARLESFIFRHRDHDTYTPDAMFRLAELYYEDTVASYNRSQDNFAREMDLYNRGKLLDPPTDQDRDFSRSIAIYKYLHWVPEGTPMSPLSGKLAGVVLEKRWPNHKLSDAAMYLQGYCESDMGELEKAVESFGRLEEHYPKSKYAAEAWLRVGEIRFDAGEYVEAAAAYERAARLAEANGDAGQYSLALYKLGWSYFQLYKYPEAVRWFQKLIEFEDKLNEEVAKSGGKKKGTGFDLRKEAIEYLAKSLAEPSWDDDGCDDFGSETSDVSKGCTIVDPRVRPILYTASVLEPTLDPALANWLGTFSGDVRTKLEAQLTARNAVRKDLMNGRPYVYDILLTYANTLYGQAENDYFLQAVRVMRHIIDNYTDKREAEEMQRKVIRAWDILAGQITTIERQLQGNPSDPDLQMQYAVLSQAVLRQAEERRRYIELFGKQSPWYAKYKGDRDLAAQVDQYESSYRSDFAALTLQQARTLRLGGKEAEAVVKYEEAAKEFERVLAEDPESPNAYIWTWTIAETWYFSGRRCDALPGKDGKPLRGPDGELVPWPDTEMVAVKSACERMAKSIEFYNKVRDWKGTRTLDDAKVPLDYTEDAASSSLTALEQILLARGAFPRTDPNRLAARSVPFFGIDEYQQKFDEEDQKAVEGAKVVVRVKRLTIDPQAVEWILAADGYRAQSDKFTKMADRDKPKKLALRTADFLYKNRHFDAWPEGATDKTPAEFWSARARYRAIMDRYPGTAQFAESVKSLLVTFAMERDFKALKELTTELKEKGGLPKEQQASLEKDIKEFELGNLADAANAMFAEGESLTKQAEAGSDPEENTKTLARARKLYDDAGENYRSLRDNVDDTKRKLAALMNGVRAFYRAEQWDKCIETLRIAEDMLRTVKETDPKEKAENVKRLELVITTRAEINYKFFNIPEAIADFRLLYQNAPQGPKAAEYLKTAADMAWFNSEWDLAIQLDREFIARFEKDAKEAEKVEDAVWRIADSQKSKGDQRGQMLALEDFIKRYASDKETAKRWFQAHVMIAEIHESKGDKPAATAMYKRILDAFNKGGFEKDGAAPAAAAAQSTFMLMKPRFDNFLATKLVENTKLKPDKRMEDMQNQVKRMLDTVLGAEQKIKKADGTEETVRKDGMYDEYLNTVAIYGSQNWSYAAFLYRAKMLKHLARTIYDAPRPEDLSDEELEAYEEFLVNFGGQIEKQAIKSLEVALKDAEAKGVVNNWVNELRKEINVFKPKEYPLLKEEKRLMVEPVGTMTLPEKELR